MVEDVLTEFLAKGPTAQELAAAKKNLIDGLALRIDSNAKMLGYLSLIGFYGLPLTYLDEFPAQGRCRDGKDDVKAAFAAARQAGESGHGDRRGRLSKIRITGGAWRSRLIQVADAPGLRPTPDRVRETLFNWLGQDLTGLACLDLFAGSGILGFEAASRGAAQRHPGRERDAKSFAALRQNAALFACDRLRAAACGCAKIRRLRPGGQISI